MNVSSMKLPSPFVAWIRAVARERKVTMTELVLSYAIEAHDGIAPWQAAQFESPQATRKWKASRR